RSTPSCFHGSFAGSRSAVTRTVLPSTTSASFSARTDWWSVPWTESYFRRCASVRASVMSLTATNSSALSPSEARNTFRPMRPKPLMPTRMVATDEASLCGGARPAEQRAAWNEKNSTFPPHGQGEGVIRLTPVVTSARFPAGRWSGAAGWRIANDSRFTGSGDDASGRYVCPGSRCLARASGHRARHDRRLGARRPRRPADPDRVLDRLLGHRLREERRDAPRATALGPLHGDLLGREEPPHDPGGLRRPEGEPRCAGVPRRLPGIAAAH